MFRMLGFKTAPGIGRIVSATAPTSPTVGRTTTNAVNCPIEPGVLKSHASWRLGFNACPDDLLWSDDTLEGEWTRHDDVVLMQAYEKLGILTRSWE